jgi:hypothetical protein
VTSASDAAQSPVDLAAACRGLLDSILYLTLATVDDDGRPRTSPLFFTAHAYRDLYWVSSPDAVHSRNLGREPRSMAVVFDSTVPVGAADAVYLSGAARQVGDAELPDRCPVAFTGRGGASVFAPRELRGDAPLRLYVLHVERAEALVRAGHPALGDGRDRRVVVDLG